MSRAEEENWWGEEEDEDGFSEEEDGEYRMHLTIKEK